MNTQATTTDAPRISPLARKVFLISLSAIAGVLLYLTLPAITSWITYGLLGLSSTSRLGRAVEFFLYDTPKVLLLLTGVVFVVGLVRSFFSSERARDLLSGRRHAGGNIVAAGLGVVTPFCSCSAVPLFIGFVTAGVPLGVTFSFLIAAPMVNEVALALLLGLFGWKVALLYLSTGLAIAIGAGWILGRMRLESHVEPWVWELPSSDESFEFRLSWEQRIDGAIDIVREIVGKVWIWIIAGIAVGAAIHGYVPQEFFASILGGEVWWSVPLAVIFGIPLYSNAAGIIPIVEALLSKGAALGSVLAFMMSVIALSLPEMIILRKVLRPRLIGVFIGVVAAGILLVGYLFNLIF